MCRVLFLFSVISLILSFGCNDDSLDEAYADTKADAEAEKESAEADDAGVEENAENEDDHGLPAETEEGEEEPDEMDETPPPGHVHAEIIFANSESELAFENNFWDSVVYFEGGEATGCAQIEPTDLSYKVEIDYETGKTKTLNVPIVAEGQTVSSVHKEFVFDGIKALEEEECDETSLPITNIEFIHSYKNDEGNCDSDWLLTRGMFEIEEAQWVDEAPSGYCYIFVKWTRNNLPE